MPIRILIADDDSTIRRLLRRLLEDHGIRDLRVVDIAREVGTSPATFYQYFRDVDEAVLVLADELTVEIEPIAGIEGSVADRLPTLVTAALADAHEGLRFGVELVAVDTLPVFELKARRLVDRRDEGQS